MALSEDQILQLIEQNNQLLQRVAQLERQAAPAPVTRNELYAPDGGPVSHAHRNMTTTLIPTVEIKMKGSGVICVIAKTDFNEEIHELVVPAPKVARARTLVEEEASKMKSVPAEVAATFGTETPEELAVMTTSVLRARPECEFIEGKLPEKKQELVDAILAVRKLPRL